LRLPSKQSPVPFGRALIIDVVFQKSTSLKSNSSSRNRSGSVGSTKAVVGGYDSLELDTDYRLANEFVDDQASQLS